MKDIADRLVDFGLVVAVTGTAVMTVATVRTQLNQPAAAESPAPERIDNWNDVLAGGTRIGPDNADVTVVVFTDFECPACAHFATTTYPELQAKYPGRTALVLRHWPLPSHRLAYPAAMAAECARQQGSLAEFYQILSAEQRQIGLKTFSEFAVDAGVSDPAMFESCLERDETAEVIDADIAQVRQLGGRGTPTVVVNGWLLRGGASFAQIDSIAARYIER